MSDGLTERTKTSEKERIAPHRESKAEKSVFFSLHTRALFGGLLFHDTALTAQEYTAVDGHCLETFELLGRPACRASEHRLVQAPSDRRKEGCSTAEHRRSTAKTSVELDNNEWTNQNLLCRQGTYVT